MSIGPTFIKADDNKFYKDPVIRGEDFFICFDEDDPPEIVIKRGDMTLDQLKCKAENILSSLSIKTKQLGNGVLSSRIFEPGNNSFKFRPAYSVYIDIISKIPANSLKENEGVFAAKPSREGTYYDFSKGK